MNSCNKYLVDRTQKIMKLSISLKNININNMLLNTFNLKSKTRYKKKGSFLRPLDYLTNFLDKAVVVKILYK